MSTKLSIGIVGLPNVGKSTLFNALTKKSVPAENYPFCTIDPSVGVVAVPDARLEILSKMSGSQKVIPAVVEFVDIAGLVKGASTGEGLGNAFLSHIRETDAIVEVVRIYEGADLIHVEGNVDPLRDVQIINMELILADMQTVEKRMQTLNKDVKKGDKDAIRLESVLKKVHKSLMDEKLAQQTDLDKEEKLLLKEVHLITMKPMLYVLNKQHGGKNLDDLNDERFQSLVTFFKQNNFQYIIIDAKIEDELKDFEGAERVEMQAMLIGGEGLVSKEDIDKASGVDALIRAGYKLLGLETYLTTGEMETRAWTIQSGSNAPRAAAAIHTDFESKFIRAEVVAYGDLLKAGSYATAKQQGLVRIEGKDYIVEDGDVMEFKI